MDLASDVRVRPTSFDILSQRMLELIASGGACETHTCVCGSESFCIKIALACDDASVLSFDLCWQRPARACIHGASAVQELAFAGWREQHSVRAVSPLEITHHGDRTQRALRAVDRVGAA